MSQLFLLSAVHEFRDEKTHWSIMTLNWMKHVEIKDTDVSVVSFWAAGPPPEISAHPEVLPPHWPRAIRDSDLFSIPKINSKLKSSHCSEWEDSWRIPYRWFWNPFIMLIFMIMINFVIQVKECVPKAVNLLGGNLQAGFGDSEVWEGRTDSSASDLELKLGDSRSSVVGGKCLGYEDKRARINLSWSYRIHHEVHTEWGWKLVHSQRIWSQRRPCRMEELEE